MEGRSAPFDVANSMQALQLTKFGDPRDSVRLVSRGAPEPVGSELLIDAHAAPVHPSDIHLIRGFYGLQPELPIDLGADGVGTVVQTPADTDREAAAAEVLAAGGDRVIVVDDDLPKRLQDALGGNELALVLDSVGGPAIAELAHHVRYGGKIVTYGALGGERTEIEVRRDLIYRDLSHHGFWMNNWLQRAPRAEIESTYRAILALVSRGELKARIDQTFPLSRYKEALARAERYERAGKLVFRPD